MAVCNLFKKLEKETGNFLMFEQYTNDLTKCFVQHDSYDITPSKFIALDVDYKSLSRSTKPAGWPTGLDLSDLNQSLSTYYQNYYENACTYFKSTTIKEDDDVVWDPVNWTPLNSANLFWNATKDLGLIHIDKFSALSGDPDNPWDVENDELYTILETRYIGNIEIHSYEEKDGVGYNEFYCYIPNEGTRQIYPVVCEGLTDTPQKFTFNGSTVLGMEQYENREAEYNMLPISFSGSVQYCKDQLFGFSAYPIQSDNTEENDIVNKIYDYNEFKKRLDLDPDNKFSFNTVIILYDVNIYDNEKNIMTVYKDIPMGIYFTGVWDGTEMTNKVTKYIAHPDIYNAGTSYGLRICSRYLSTPNTNTVDIVEIDPADQYAGFSQAMSSFVESQTKMNEIISLLNRDSNDIKDHLAIFKNNRTNVPYIRKVNGRNYWFINGRNTGVPCSGEDGKDGNSTNITIEPSDPNIGSGDPSQNIGYFKVHPANQGTISTVTTLLVENKHLAPPKVKPIIDNICDYNIQDKYIVIPVEDNDTYDLITQWAQGFGSDISFEWVHGGVIEDEFKQYKTEYHWHINGVDTGIRANGLDGIGIDGHTPEMTVSAKSTWVIDGIDTNKKIFVTPTIEDNHWVVDGRDLGKSIVDVNIDKDTGHWVVDGKDAGPATPTLSTNNTWVVAGKDTGIKAQIVPEIDKDTKNWIINGRDTGVKSKGDIITIKDNKWVINGEKTDIKAVGDTVEINENGYWAINGEATEHNAIYKSPEISLVEDEQGNQQLFIDGQNTGQNISKTCGFYVVDDPNIILFEGGHTCIEIDSTTNSWRKGDKIFYLGESKYINDRSIITKGDLMEIYFINEISNVRYFVLNKIQKLVVESPSITIKNSTDYDHKGSKIAVISTEDRDVKETVITPDVDFMRYEVSHSTAQKKYTNLHDVAYCCGEPKKYGDHYIEIPYNIKFIQQEDTELYNLKVYVSGGYAKMNCRVRMRPSKIYSAEASNKSLRTDDNLLFDTTRKYDEISGEWVPRVNGMSEFLYDYGKWSTDSHYSGNEGIKPEYLLDTQLPYKIAPGASGREAIGLIIYTGLTETEIKALKHSWNISGHAGRLSLYIDLKSVYGKFSELSDRKLGLTRHISAFGIPDQSPNVAVINNPGILKFDNDPSTKHWKTIYTNMPVHVKRHNKMVQGFNHWSAEDDNKVASTFEEFCDMYSPDLMMLKMFNCKKTKFSWLKNAQNIGKRRSKTNATYLDSYRQELKPNDRLENEPQNAHKYKRRYIKHSPKDGSMLHTFKEFFRDPLRYGIVADPTNYKNLPLFYEYCEFTNLISSTHIPTPDEHYTKPSIVENTWFPSLHGKHAKYIDVAAKRNKNADWDIYRLTLVTKPNCDCTESEKNSKNTSGRRAKQNINGFIDLTLDTWATKPEYMSAPGDLHNSDTEMAPLNIAISLKTFEIYNGYDYDCTVKGHLKCEYIKTVKDLSIKNNTKKEKSLF